MKKLLSLIALRHWKRLIIYCVSFIGVFFIDIALDVACGPEVDPYDYYISFFHNNPEERQTYHSFNFTSWQFLYNYNEILDENTVNSNEWATYLGKGVRSVDVERVMYKLNGHTDTLLLNGYFKAKGKLPDSLKSNTFLKAIAADKHRHALQYYQFAKWIETAGWLGGSNKWDTLPVDSTIVQKAGLMALKKANAETDKFLKLRYYYLAQRSMHYSGHYTDALNIYDRYIAGYPSKSHVKGWALSLKAGEERKIGHKEKAAYLFAKVFVKYPERRNQAYANYHYIGVTPQSVIKLAVNNNEKAFIYAIDSFNNPYLSLDALQKVYLYEPGSELVRILLIREINKIEERYLTLKLTNKFPYAKTQYPYMERDSKTKDLLATITKLKNFCRQLCIENKYPKPALGYLALAYLSWMQNKTGESYDALSKIDGENLDADLYNQQQIIKLLLSAQKINTEHKVNEAELLPLLTWLYKKAKTEQEHHADKTKDIYNEEVAQQGFSTTLRNFYQMVLTPAYLKLKDTTRAALAILKSETDFKKIQNTDYEPWGMNNFDFWQNYLNSKRLKQLIAWKRHSPDNGYLKLLSTELNNISYSNLYDLLGTMYLREHAYAKAIRYLEKRVPKIKKKGEADFYIDNRNGADPFFDLIKDYPKKYYQADAKSYTKIGFAKEMLALQGKAKSDPKNGASYYYKMACGLYNTSFSGNAWHLISYTWSDEDYFRQDKYVYDYDYQRSETAKKYYLMAREASSNAELKARCTFMAAKCAQKEIPVPVNSSYDDPDAKYDRAVRLNPYFKTLHKRYSQTAFYKLAVHECSYLRDYLASASTRKN